MLLAVLASVVFGGCSPSQKAAPQPEPTVPLTGMVTYRERMALPPDAELTVTLHRKTSDGRMLVAEERASTESRNVPLPFSIACPAADSSSMSYELEAAISSGGTTLFATTRPLMVHPGDADVMVLTHRVMDAAPVTDGLAGTRWKLVELNGKPAEVYDTSRNRTCSLILKARKAGFPVPTAATASSAVIPSKAIASVFRSSARP